MSGRSWFVLIVSVAAILMVGLAWAADKTGKAYLGVVPGEITSDIATDYGTQAGIGVLVEDVASGSPADKAGIRTNDVILKIGGQSPTGPEEFRKQLAKYKPDDSIELTYIRGGKQNTLSVKLGEKKDWNFGWWPKRDMKDFRFEGSPWEWRSESGGSKRAYAGLVTQKLGAGLATYFKVEKGVLISEVVKGSPAEAAGLKAGDVIIKIGDDSVDSEGDVSEAVRKHKPGDVVDFVIARDGQTSVIKVTLGERSSETGHMIRMRRGSADMGEMEIPDLSDLQSLDQLKDLRIRIKDLKDLQSLDSLHAALKELQIEIEGVPDAGSDSLDLQIVTPDLDDVPPPPPPPGRTM